MVAGLSGTRVAADVPSPLPAATGSGNAPTVVLSEVPARVPWSDHLVGRVTVSNTTDRELHFVQPIRFQGFDDQGNPVDYSEGLRTIGAILPEGKIAPGQTMSFPVALPTCDVETAPCTVRGAALVYPARLAMPYNWRLAYLSNVVSYTLLRNPAATFRAQPPFDGPLNGIGDGILPIFVREDGLESADDVSRRLGAYLGVLPLAFNGESMNHRRAYEGARAVRRVSFEVSTSAPVDAYDAPADDGSNLFIGLSTVWDRTELFAVAVTDSLAAAASGVDPRTAALAEAARRADALARDLGAHADIVTLVAAYPPQSLGDNRMGFPVGVARAVAGQAIVPAPAPPVATPRPEPTHTPGMPYSTYAPRPYARPSDAPVPTRTSAPIEVPDAARTATGSGDERVAWPADRLRMDVTIGLAAMPRIPMSASKAADRLRVRPDVEDVAFSEDRAQRLLPIHFEVIIKNAARTTVSAIVDAIRAEYPGLPVLAVAHGAVHDCWEASLAAQRQSVRAALRRVSLAARDRSQHPRTLVLAIAGAPHADRGACQPSAAAPGYADTGSRPGLTIDPKPSITIDVPVTLTYRTYEPARPPAQ